MHHCHVLMVSIIVSDGRLFSLRVCGCRDNEQGMTEAQWPGLPSQEFAGHHDAHYSEGQIVGYRFYDKHDIEPAFAFGHGPSTAKPLFFLSLGLCGAHS